MNIMLDDTNGYFVIGGGKFIHGIEGYYGPTTFYRLQGLPADQVEYHIFMFLYYIQDYIQSELHCIHSIQF